MKKKVGFLLMLVAMFILASCKTTKVFKISILATSDVHCGINENIGYAGISEYRNKRVNEGYKTVLVDCGDVIQGDAVGLLSRGSDVIDIINKLDYKLFTLGNHEFDYGMDELASDIDKFNGEVLSCNLKYVGENENKLTNIKPYEILTFGKTKVGFVGITTPESTSSSTPAVFMENNKFAYYFSNDTKEEFYDTIQDSINDCKKDGAEYIILLSHLGYGEEYMEFGSQPTMENLSGYDIILDGHSHKDMFEHYNDKDGKEKPLLELGTKMDCFAEIIITNKGIENIEVIKEYDEKDHEIVDFIDSKLEALNNKLGQKIATSDLSLDIYENKIRITRNQESLIGNFYADAYRNKFDTDIAIINGGGIRAGFEAGDISYNVLYKMAPYGNYACVIKAKGQDIVNYLEFASCKRVKETNDGTNPVGEFGGFAVVSGLKYTIDTNIASTVEFNQNGVCTSLGENRRVKDVKVLINNVYEDIDLNKDYTISGISYVLMNMGDGNTLFNNCEVVLEPMPQNIDVDVLKDYFVYLNGSIASKYNSLEGRINIITE